MTIFRSYFSKNNTIIKDNKTNNGHNPVTEISYNGEYSPISRFIFDIDLTDIIEKIASGNYQRSNVIKHTLNLKNTISMSPQYIGGKFVDKITNRASSFKMDLFEVNEAWSEGSGYDFIYNQALYPLAKESASNWFNNTSNTLWDNEGVYLSGTTNIIATMEFDGGNEDINVDITNFINNKLDIILSGGTDLNFGFGLKFSDDFETLTGTTRNAVAFHTRFTHTFFEPFLETTVNDNYLDDREYFYLDENNSLVSTFNNQNGSLVINNVQIFDYNGELFNTISGSNITKLNNTTYKIGLNIPSNLYPDAVIFNDVWNYTYNGVAKTLTNDFYLMSNDILIDNLYANYDNYNIIIQGLKCGDELQRGDTRKLIIGIKELYKYVGNKYPLDVQYRIYTKQAKHFNIDIIPLTKMNRIKSKYYLDIDTSWFIAQDYTLEIKIVNVDIVISKKLIDFSILSDIEYVKTSRTI